MTRAQLNAMLEMARSELGAARYGQEIAKSRGDLNLAAQAAVDADLWPTHYALLIMAWSKSPAADRVPINDRVVRS